MREGWEIIPFENSIQKVKYTTKVPSSDYLPVGAFPIVSQEEGLISGYWNNQADVFHHSRPVVIFGDHTRIIKYVDFDFVLGADGVKILLPIDGLSAKFLSYYLRWYKVPSLGYSRHFKLLKEASVPVPPVKEQEKIVAELDCLSGIIEKKKQQLKELDNLAQSIFYDMFGEDVALAKGWKVKTLGEIGSFQRGGGFLKKDYVENGVPCLHYGQIHTRLGVATYKHLTCIPDTLLPKTKIASHGDLIMAITSEDVEGSCKSTAWMGDYDIAVGAHTAIFKHTLNPIFASYITKSARFNAAKQNFTHGIKVIEITPKDIATIAIPVPPRDLQDLFAKKFEAIEKQKELINKSIQETETLFNSRMDYWFN